MDVIESVDELMRCSSDGRCQLFTFDGQVHLAYVYKCYDGDTIYCNFKHDGQYYSFHVRMEGYDSCEMKPSKSIPETERNEIIRKAKEAKTRLEELVLGKCVYLFCGKFDKYGRILGKIKVNLNDTEYVNDVMKKEGYGYEYYGGTKNK